MFDSGLVERLLPVKLSFIDFIAQCCDNRIAVPSKNSNNEHQLRASFCIDQDRKRTLSRVFDFAPEATIDSAISDPR